MITSIEEYQAYLYQLHKDNRPMIGTLMPTNETIYEIDLNTRKINSPEFLSLELDHYAEIIYFKADRYFDNMDLTNTTCVIQYINENAKDANGLPAGGFLYPVPFYDVNYCQDNFNESNKILIPWAIGGPATAAAGRITFSFRFYQINAVKENNQTNYYLVYNLSTQPATSKILHGLMDQIYNEKNENLIFDFNQIDVLIQSINEAKETAMTYWLEV